MGTARLAGRVKHVFAAEVDTARLHGVRDLNNVTVIQAAAQDTGLAENSCDAIFLRDVYHHWLWNSYCILFRKR